jgi:hypothetical protein
MILRQCPSRLKRRRRLSASRAPARLITTKSTPGSPTRAIRNDSRITRFIRFRSTALPEALRDIAIPSLASPVVLALANTVKKESAERLLSRKTRENSVGLVRRLRRGKVWDRSLLRRTVRSVSLSIRGRAVHGLWRGDEPGPGGRPWLPCGHEIRGCARA